MWHRASDLQFLLISIASALIALAGHAQQQPSPPPRAKPPRIDISADGASVTIHAPSADDPLMRVAAAGLSSPLLGHTERFEDRLRFVPALPFAAGQKYNASWRSASGDTQQVEFQPGAPSSARPTLQLRPNCTLPSNALRLYLHFSEPMEQGVFLEKLRLLDSAGREITGPFRETELWSPDGKRLTIWFHPGRQKTGVNLQADEGPVLTARSRHSLLVAGDWRSTQGVAIGQEVRFPISTSDADHTCPAVSNWRLTLPRPQSLDPLLIDFDEPLDTAILSDALSIQHAGVPLKIQVAISDSGTQWQGRPQEAWRAGDYELHASSILEDLAGNNLLHPFEVDIEKRATTTPPLIRTFSLQALHEK